MPRVTRTNLLLDQNITFNQPASGESENLPEHIDKLAFGYRCKLCQKHPNQRVQVDLHVNSRQHQSMLVLLSLQKNQAYALSNKNDVTVDILNGEEMHTEPVVYKFKAEKKQLRTLIIRVHNHNNESVALDFCNFTKAGKSKFFKIVGSHGNKRIPAETKREVKIETKVPNVGKFSKSVFFKFSMNGSDENGREPFYIVKHLTAVCSDEITKELKPTEPYKPVPRAAIQHKNLEIVPGMRLPKVADDTLEIVRPLTGFRIQAIFRSAVNHGLKEDAESADVNVQTEIDRIRDLFKTPLTFDNYEKRWSVLLRLEKLQADINIQTYNMSAVTMKICRENKAFLDLQIPGLAENRPSVLKGDVLFVSFAKQDDKDDDKNKEYEGFVHHVGRDNVWLGFSERLMSKVRADIGKIKWNVRFVVPEHVYRLQDRAVRLAKDDPNLEKILFPKDEYQRPGLMHPLGAATKFFNEDVKGNPEQAKAVRHIVSGTSRPAPYLIFGPAGTGKTVTLVESILQTLHVHSDSHILACAPSNSAADLITERLATMMPKPQQNLYRIHARSRSWLTVPDSIKQLSNHRKGDFCYPARATIQEKKVVVTTLATAGRLASAAFPEGHFTHLFIDECGQATETEAVIALAGILSYDTAKVPKGAQVVLAGDPKQLGPIIHSPFAAKLGMGVSLLERLMRDSPLYKRSDSPDQPYDVTVMTELRHNYRSHPAILEVPNKEFYHGDLYYSADKKEREMFCNWKELPKKDFPVIFHGILGEEYREGSSPSFFNPDEISIVVEYMDKILKEDKTRGLKYSDIGIITPYRKQVEKIRKLLKKMNPKLEDVRVGTVEEFQGQERKVIIVSTVRSNPDYGEFDTKFKLGFVSNPKKFNVAITRAMALLIVVGNPFCLKHDEYWCSFLRHCQKNEALIGVDMEELLEADEEPEEEILNDVVKEMLNLRVDLTIIRPDTPDQTKFYTAPDLKDENIVLVQTLQVFRDCSKAVLKPDGVVAIDAEWTASLFHGREQSLGLLQLAVEDKVFVLDIPELKRNLPTSEWANFFTKLFASDEITKVGFQIAGDLSIILTTFRNLNLSKNTTIKEIMHPNNLKRVCDLYVRGLELEKIPDFFLPRDCSGESIQPGGNDLCSLVRKTEGKLLNKVQQLSNWDQRPLLTSQLRYAAMDAHVLLAIYKYVDKRMKVLDVKVDLFKKLNNKFWNKLYGPSGREKKDA